MIKNRLTILGSALLFVLPFSSAAETDLEAIAFGSRPALWGVKLSPDGSKVSFLQMHPKDFPIAVVYDLQTGKGQLALASVEDKFDLRDCDWANNTRLLCGFYGIERRAFDLIPKTRLVAVDADGGDMKILLERKLKAESTQFQDNIVDWLVDDASHVLIAVPSNSGIGVGRLNIYSGSVRTTERSRAGAYRWISDGRGTPRLRQVRTGRENKWFYRPDGQSEWRSLTRTKVTDLDDSYLPVGFGDDPTRFFVLKSEQGRRALWEEQLEEDRSSRLVFSHPDVDVGQPLFLGKFNRMVAIRYETDRGYLHYFDKEIKGLSDSLRDDFPDDSIHVIGESWDRRYHLLRISNDQEPAIYYRHDNRKDKVEALSNAYPRLKNLDLARMLPIRFDARDGTSVPGYLTKPLNTADAPLPTVVLPHGGPQSRDSLRFQWIVQFLAAKGYAVLQVNFRGSGGYGKAWAGPGGFQAWRQVVDDISDGLNHLVETGIADPQRVCIVGWSYGGYASLLSTLEEPDQYQCAVSIAGVTDPLLLIKEQRFWVGGRGADEFIGTDLEVLSSGSPLKRAREFRRPILLFHGDEDINVRVQQSRKLASALRRAKKTVQYVEYEQVEHQIARDGYRIDMLARIGRFLDQHIGKAVKKRPTSDGPVR